MTRSADFGLTVSKGVRAAQPDLVVHAMRAVDGEPNGPKVGFVVSKSVGSAVQRHRVARKLRHVARNLVADLDAGDRIVIRALPGSRVAASSVLEQELRAALHRTRARMGASR